MMNTLIYDLKNYKITYKFCKICHVGGQAHNYVKSYLLVNLHMLNRKYSMIISLFYDLNEYD